MECVVISHNGDIDGVAAGALIRMKYGVPVDRLFYVDYSKGSLERAVEKIRKLNLRNINLFIADLNPGNDTEKVFLKLIDEVKGSNGKVLWLDHHPWTESSMKSIKGKCDFVECGENRNECATELVIKHLGLKGEFIEKLGKIIHLSDFNLPPEEHAHKELIKTYALGIAYYNTLSSEECDAMLRLLADEISKGKFHSREIVRDAKIFDEMNKASIKEMLKDLRYVGDTIAVGFAEGSVQSTNACGEIIKKSKKDIAICVNVTKDKVNLRSIERDITGLARAFGGGGHPHASGFQLELKKYDMKSKEGRLKLVKDIEKTARKLDLA